MKISILRIAFAWILTCACSGNSNAATNTLYSTGFETSEGYVVTDDLAGQKGWLSLGTGGNGLLNEWFPGKGNQGYIGFSPPTDSSSTLLIWQPVNHNPAPTNIVKFSVLMSIVDSTSTNYDDFRWTVYNTQGDSLFTLDFDNSNLGISYAFERTNDFVYTGKQFSNDVPYKLELTMNFSLNRWSASLDQTLLATNLPISVSGLPLNLGDVDAVWAIRNTQSPGNNFMVFDDYRITTETVPNAIPIQLLSLGRTNNQFQLRLNGEAGERYAVEASTNFVQWTALRTNVATNGTFTFIDAGSATLPRRFYRARLVP